MSPSGVERPPRTPLRGFARLAVVTAVVALAVVALGGVVRATDSGLACPTWPGCFYAGDFVPQRDLSVWLEHSHRLLAGALGLLIAGGLGWALLRHRDRPRIVWPLAAASAAVLVQAALGAAVVLFQLQAELVTAHLGMGMAVVGLLLFVALEAAQGTSSGERAGGDRRLARTSLAVAALTYVQILVGGHVTGVGAGLVYAGSPLLGIATFAPIERESQLFNVAHRVLAVALVVAIGVLVRRTKASGATGWLARLPHVASALVVLQVLLGVANLWSGLSPLSVIPHLAVASWIWAVLVLHAALASRAAAGLPAAVPGVRGTARRLAWGQR